jgi:Small subunit of serine palmitoyltransferase-like
MTTVRPHTIQNPQLLRLVGSKPPSKGIVPPQSSPRSSALNQAVFLDLKGEFLPIHHTSFDSTPTSPAWYVQPPRNTSRVRLWLKRRYYQYEVTWGPYVLTPSEKIIINSLVLIMFSLIAYVITKIVVLQRAVIIIIQYIGVLVRQSPVALRELSDFYLHTI